MAIFNKLFSISFLIIIFSYIIYKLINYPITHDEIKTVLFYSKFNVWEIMMYPDNIPNNHILNTLSAQFFITFLGKDTWVIRLPNLISFLIYVYGVYRIINLLFKQNSVFVITALLLFVTNSYLLDFFGLCRGYGMCAAFVTLSTSFILSGYDKDSKRDIWYGVFFAILASYANFSSLIFWAAITILAFVYFVVDFKKDKKATFKNIGYLVTLSIGYLALIAVPLMKITSTNQFVFWTSKGFYEETLISSVKGWASNNNFLRGININILGGIIIGFMVLASIISIWKFIKNNYDWSVFKTPVVISFMVLMLTVTINLIQILLLDTPNLEGRTALFFYPLFIIVIVCLIYELNQSKLGIIKYIVAAIIPVLLLVHIAKAHRFNVVQEWWYEQNNLEVIQYINSTTKGQETPPTLMTKWQFHPSFHYYDVMNEIDDIVLMPANKNTETQTNADFYYVFDSDIDLLKENYIVVQKYDWGRSLMKKKEDVESIKED